LPRYPRITARQLTRALERARFEELPASGGHLQFRHRDSGRRVTVPYHAGRTIEPKLLAFILRQAGLTVDELRELL
jgi:predicted RNA binding protein YcfA (HicA-like mRNA interferase family)